MKPGDPVVCAMSMYALNFNHVHFSSHTKMYFDLIGHIHNMFSKLTPLVREAKKH